MVRESTTNRERLNLESLDRMSRKVGTKTKISSAGRQSNPVGNSSSPAATAAEVCRGERERKKEEQEATRESYGAWGAQKATKLPQSKTQGERRGTTAEPRGRVARCGFGAGEGAGSALQAYLVRSSRQGRVRTRRRLGT